MKCLLLSVVLVALVTAQLPSFPPGNPWNLDITNAPVATESTTVLNYVQGLGGWGAGATHFQIDFSINYMRVNCTTANYQPFTQWPGGYTMPDCMNLTVFPMPAGGAIEGSTDYTCDYQNGDCHMLVLDESTGLLYESYQTSQSGNGIGSGCGIAWNTAYLYPAHTRGDECTSCDAAGYPIAPLLFSADEIVAGSINHAIRFILPNNRIQHHYFFNPATHAAGSSTNAAAMIYGSRLRLKSSFDTSAFSTSAKVVLAALKKYGMFLADGGNIPLTAQNDFSSSHKWAELTDFDSHALFNVQITDFELIAHPNQIYCNYSCELDTTIPVDPVPLANCAGANCPGGGSCNGHGACNSGTCSCYSGWSGSDCGTYSGGTGTAATPVAPVPLLVAALVLAVLKLFHN